MATKNYCRSGLVRESDVSGTEDIACADVFADESAPTEGRVCCATARRLDDGGSPTGDRGQHKVSRMQKSAGASLPAKTAYQPPICISLTRSTPTKQNARSSGYGGRNRSGDR